MSVPKDLGAAAMAAALTMAIVSAAPASAADEEKPPAGQLQGTDLGGKAMMFYVARDKAQWEAVKKAAGGGKCCPGAPDWATRSRSSTTPISTGR